MNKLWMGTLALLLGIGQAACAQSGTEKQTDMKDKKVLVAFFSRADENYGVGYIEKGNTQIVAELIGEATGGTLFHVEPASAYPADYNSCIEVAKQEQQAHARPAVAADIAVEDYDIIFLGYPNWWGDLPMPLYTFIEKHNWQGKTVIPFCTHEGSGLGSTPRSVAKACKGATVLDGLAIQGVTAQRQTARAKAGVESWLKKLKL